MADFDLVDRARAAVSDRAELPGIEPDGASRRASQTPHPFVAYLLVGFAIAYAFHVRLYGIIQKPLDDLHIALNFTHPTDGLNLYLKTALYGGAILAGPFHPLPTLAVHRAGNVCEREAVRRALHAATVFSILFGSRFATTGAAWSTRFTCPRLWTNFHPILTIEDYTSFF